MWMYFLRRLLLVFPTFLGITLMVFAVTRFVPGGPVERMLAEAQMASEEQGGSDSVISGMGLSEGQIKELEAYYGFDKPLLQSYFSWLGKVLQLDLGLSLIHI